MCPREPHKQCGTGHGSTLSLFIFLLFLPYHAACGILVPPPEIRVHGSDSPSLNHWIAKEVPQPVF